MDRDGTVDKANKVEVGSFQLERGRPRYCTGKVATGHIISEATLVRYSLEHWIGMTTHLEKFIWSPEAVRDTCISTRTSEMS